MVCPDCGTDFAPELDMEAIRARLEAATPGPWESGDVWARAGLVFDDHHNHVGTNNPTKCGYCFTGDPLILAEVMDINGRDMEAHLHRRVEPWDLDEFVSGAGGVVVARKVAGEANVELIAHAPTDLRRLLDENARLNAEFADFREMAVLNTRARNEALAARDRTVEALSARLTAKNAELDKVIREAAADKAKAAEDVDHLTRQRDDAEQDLVGWSYRIDAVQELHGPTDLTSVGVPDHKHCMSCDQTWPCATARALDAAPEMPRPPAEEAAWSDADRVCAFDGCGESCRHDEENPVPPAQEPVSGPETPGTGSGRGTGVAEAPGTAQVDDDV